MLKQLLLINGHVLKEDIIEANVILRQWLSPEPEVDLISRDWLDHGV